MATGATPRQIVSVRMSDVRHVPLQWLWTGRIPLGKLTIVEGEPNQGKSTMLLDLAARVSSGRPMPFEQGGGAARDVVLVSCEDGVEDTIQPRLAHAGGDPKRVHHLSGMTMSGGTDLLTLPGDTEALKAFIGKTGAALVVIDPFVAFLAPQINSFRDQDIRRALAPLALAAAETGAAMVLVRHLNKNTEASAMHRGGGSIGLVGAARSSLLVGTDPENPERRVVTSVKGNLAIKPRSAVFQLVDTGLGAAFVEWVGEGDHDADALLAAAAHAGRDGRQIDSAVALLRSQLAGGPVRAQLVEQAAAEEGISKRTLERARKKMGVIPEKVGFNGSSYWEWSLPKTATGEAVAAFDGDVRAGAR